VLAVSSDAFKRASEADRAIVVDEMRAVFKRLDKINRDDNLAATAALKSQGIQAVAPSAAEIKRWQDFSDTSIDSMIKSGLIDRDIVEAIQALLVDIRK
jgi:TRAP-type C4-dicarboxylate transport system substrate-binding protein